MSADVLIAGAGIVGTSCALELARAGMRVTVVDAHLPGGGATAAGMGHIVVMDDSDAQFSLTRLSQQLWNGILPAMPAGVEFLLCGTVWVAADEEEMEEVHRKHGFYAGCGVPSKVLSAQELAVHEPNLRRGLEGGLLMPEDSVIYPPVAARLFLDEAISLGSTFETGEVTELTGEGARLRDGRFLPAARVVNACGASSPQLTPGIAVQPRKGHLVITDRYPGYLRSELVELGYLKAAHGSREDSVAFNAQPRASGQVLIGSSRQFGVIDASIESAMLQRMLRRAKEYLPGVGELKAIRTWTGFRAATPDSLPLIGPLSERLWLATGHQGLGITTALGTAHLLAAQMSGRTPAIDPAPYLPTREIRSHA